MHVNFVYLLNVVADAGESEVHLNILENMEYYFQSEINNIFGAE
jgi:hypothetical protein